MNFLAISLALSAPLLAAEAEMEAASIEAAADSASTEAEAEGETPLEAVQVTATRAATPRLRPIRCAPAPTCPPRRRSPGPISNPSTHRRI